jgi:eukaryotic-like serine/threonine-protein kinase
MTPGTRLGPYEIVAPIGAGGMGEVYKARDTRLDRSVAIKILPAELAQNSQFKLRFEREAKTISRFSHPHICALYDVGENYLVMELLEGETLAARLTHGPLPIADAVQIAIHIADALEQAHRAGIIHRDLKPGNVMLSSAGVKLLDFGLAKPSLPAETASATIQKAVTEEGTIVGTLQYMAPEQLEGRDTDGRADIFALGAILYEMISGRRAFEGQSRASVIAKILGAEPPSLTSLRQLTPPPLDRIVKRCLEKHPARRWQCAGDLRRELELLGEQEQAEKPTRSRSLLAIAILLGLLALTETVWLLLHRNNPSMSQQAVRFTIDPPPNLAIKAANDTGPPAISPDGKVVAFIASELHSNQHALWLRDLAAVAPRRIEATEGAAFPFWSPDGKSIGFFAGGKMKRLDLDGGAPQTLANASFSRGATWGADGKIVFSPDPFGPLYRISARGGSMEQLTRLDEKAGETSHRWPFMLPDGRHVLLLVRSLRPKQPGDSIDVVDVQSGERKYLLPAVSGAA